LAGESIKDLAKEYRISRFNLRKVLNEAGGKHWAIRFNCKELNIDEVVGFKVPPLLDDKTLAAIRAQAEANKTYKHRHITNRYLLSRMIGCAHCGYAMFGRTESNTKISYYNHLHKSSMTRPCPGPAKKTCPRAAEIEDAVMWQLFEVFGNPAKVQQAIEEAVPNDEKIQDALRQKVSAAKELEKVKAARKRAIDLVDDGAVSHEEIKTKLGDLSEREQKWSDKLAQLDVVLGYLPSKDAIKAKSAQIADQFKRKYSNVRLAAKIRLANHAFDAMTYEEKRQLCQTVFSGKTADGRRMGVWLTWDKTGKKWRYEIHGHLIETGGPWSKDVFTFGAATEQEALTKTKASLPMQ
jgi:hypothetical protein